eukprot:gene25590-34153_t
MDDEKFDDVFGHVAGTAGGIEPLLTAFFGFLHRKTDFYVQFRPEKGRAYKMGFPVGEAEKMLLQTFHKFPHKEFDGVKAPSTEKIDKPVNISPVGSQDESINESHFETEKNQGEDSNHTNESYSRSLIDRKVNIDPSGKQLPIGNGGLGPNYYWTQTLKDLTVYVDVGKGTRGKDVKCTIQPRKIVLSVKGITLLDGTLDESVKTEDSMWTIADSRQTNGDSQIVISFEKCKKTWWKSVIEGHPQIDATKRLQESSLPLPPHVPIG